MNKDLKLIHSSEKACQNVFERIDEIAFFNSQKVINAFKANRVSEIHFNGTTGYGYNDLGREVIEKVYADIFRCEDALVRGQFISGTHALTVTLFALLRPGDTLLSITGKPYDTFDSVIGIKDNPSSLKAYGINYQQIDLINDEFDKSKIQSILNKKKIKVITIQRSKGYSRRKSISITKLEQIIKLIRKINEEVIIMIDNCYCEFVSKKEPSEVGADIVVGSLIKNLGAGIAPNGAYVVGKASLIKLVAERLTAPGQGKEVGPSLGMNKPFLQGLFLAPSVVANSLKIATLTSHIMAKLGYKVEPTYDEERADIVQTITFNNEEQLVKYCQAIQASSPIDSFVKPIGSQMPGYQDKIIMASGSFTQGSSIEMSCDGPIRSPFIAFQQGGLTYYYGKISIATAIKAIKEN